MGREKTKDRQKYLDGISDEERAIRFELAVLRYRLKQIKKMASLIPGPDNAKPLGSVRRIKFAIEALKKQLPQKPYFCDEPNYWCWCCPGCHSRLYDLGVNYFYCRNCGQRML